MYTEERVVVQRLGSLAKATCQCQIEVLTNLRATVAC